MAEEFFETIQDTPRCPWSVAESDFMFEKTRGERPPDLQERQKFTVALLRLAAEDTGVHRLTMEVNHLMKPTSVLRAPEIVNRVTALMAAGE